VQERFMEFNSILVGTDYSDCSGIAFSAALTLAKRFDARLVVLHVIDQNFLEKLSAHVGKSREDMGKELRHKAEREMAAFLKQWNPSGHEVDSLIATGMPFQEIAVLARDLVVDLVVVGGYGRKGRGKIEEVFFGSTAEKVVRLLPCPVLCIPK
jgi:nucleotide-binding universal stress UspA family protein